MTDEELLEEAKRRYPVGTKFYPAHMESNRDNVCCVEDTDRFICDERFIKLSVDNYKKNGHTYREVVFYKPRNKWAEIIPNDTITSPSKHKLMAFTNDNIIGVQFRCCDSDDTIFTIIPHELITECYVQWDSIHKSPYTRDMVVDFLSTGAWILINTPSEINLFPLPFNL